MQHETLSIVHAQSTMVCMKELGNLISRTRERAGFRTQKAFADAWGKDPSFVSKVENGLAKEMLPPNDVHLLHDLLGLPVADIVSAAGYRIDPESDDVLTGSQELAQEVCQIAGMVDWDSGRMRVVNAILNAWMDEDRAGLRLVAESSKRYDDKE